VTRQPAAGRRIALILEYDGGRYLGSQVQKRGPTIQGELEGAIRRLTGERLRAAFAGRTDAGVHARAQVAAFTTTSRHRPDVIVRGLNAWLPDDIAVRHAVEVADKFDPRRHALSRTYRYTVYNDPVRSPLWRDRAWHVKEPLDVERMARAARYLVGEHDFAAFSRREPTTTVRQIQRCDVERHGPLVTLEVEANAFLRQQVRRTAGALVQVGRRKLALTAFRAVLRRAQPNSAGPLAPACGLCLLDVAYQGLDLSGPTRYHKPSR
jgi:tRNA pseudouridine38-40 synthase